MTIPEILTALSAYTGRFPLQAVEAAVQHREEITPHLLQNLEAVAAAPADFAKQPDAMLHVYALYLLAQFRDKRAFPLAIRIFSAPGEIPVDLIGETVTEGLENILASLYDGDLPSLQLLLENPEANEWVRGAVVRTFMVLGANNLVPWPQVVEYFHELLRGRLNREPGNVWDSLADAVVQLREVKLLPDLRRAYDDGLVDPFFAFDYSEAVREINSPAARTDEDEAKPFRLIDDAAAEMSWWAAFAADDEEDPDDFLDDDMADEAEADAEPGLPFQPGLPPSAYVPPQPLRNPPKVGRNDPCPCGSGKKFKKCCLGKPETPPTGPTDPANV